MGSASEGFRHSVPMSSRFTKKSLVSVSGCLVKTPSPDRPTLAFSTRIPPSSTVISGTLSVSRWARSSSNSASDRSSPLRTKLEAVHDRFEHGKGFHVGQLLRRVGAPWREGNLHLVPSLLGGG